MFDLEAAIAAWRRPLEHVRSVSNEDLRELENHLRDAVEEYRADGRSEEAAFRMAVRDMDDPFLLEREYGKVFWKKASHSRRLSTEIQRSLAMLSSHVRVSLRSLGRQKAFAAINIFGLSVGIAACLLLLLFIREELSFDRFHENGDRIARVVRIDEGSVVAHQPSVLGTTISSDLAGMEAVVRFRKIDEVQLELGDGSIRYEEEFLYADSAFFDVFSFQLKSGDTATALDRPWSVVLTEDIAEKYFQGENPLGSQLVVRNAGTFTVTGVLATPPEASSIRFNLLASFSTLTVHPREQGMLNSGWFASAYPTYVLLEEGASPESSGAALNDLVQRSTDAEYIQRAEFRLQPLEEVHFTEASGALGPAADSRYLYIFSTIAGLILAIACVNYVNLATARSVRRAREVGIRKTVGAHRSLLLRQFLTESTLTAGIALLIALVIVYITVDSFGTLVDRAVTFSDVVLPQTLIYMFAVVVLVGLVAGAYPALVLTRYKPAEVLKGFTSERSAGGRLRKALVVFQFSIATVLIVSTVAINRQLHFVQDKDLGLEENRVVVVPLTDENRTRADVFANAFRLLPDIADVSVSGSIPTRTSVVFGFEINDEQIFAPLFPADARFIETLGMRLVAGRGFSDEINDSGQSRMGGAIVNEALAALLPEGDPVGQELPFTPNGRTYRIVGVVEDFHYTSLHDVIEPAVIVPVQDYWSSHVIVRTSSDDYADILSDLESAWADIAPSHPFEYQFLDDSFDQLYKGPYQFANLFYAFSMLTILIACLGLYGLASFSASRRTREIGVRKALGATRGGIVTMFSREFLVLVLVAFVVSIPIAWLVVTRWLETFAYRIEVGATIYIAAAAITAAIALVTVSSQALRAASVNPTTALRHE